jgi:hypothetical protein
VVAIDRNPPGPPCPTTPTRPTNAQSHACFPIARTNLLAVHFDVGDVILEYRRHVHVWELVLAEDDEQTCFAARAVADDHQLLANCSHWLGEVRLKGTEEMRLGKARGNATITPYRIQKSREKKEKR